MKVTWYGHACYGIEGGGAKLIIDPFLTGNAQAAIKPEEVEADYIFVTHGHGDHFGDTIDIARRTGAEVVANFEVCNYAQQQGCEKIHPLHIGGGFQFPFGRAQLTIAHHGSSMPDGSYGGNPAGILFTIEGKKIYHAGDTGLFYDMKLIGEGGLDLALLPIGDNFTMGPEDSIRAIQLLAPQQVVPYHYNTFEVIEQDPQAWAEKVGAQTSAKAIILEPGKSLHL